MVLHDLHLATRFCDHAIAIGDGKARAAKAPELLNAASLSELFGRPLAELSGSGLRTFVPAVASPRTLERNDVNDAPPPPARG